uniref:Transmembrane protein n=1 Tax=Medicago truncatula TaxID=3880 RepID=B7FFM6_MEDTR|nr:unknown [Medicago truncatula]
MNRFHVECVMGEDISLMYFLCLILFVSDIHPWLITVNVLVAPFDRLEPTIYNFLYDTIY